MRKIRTYVDTSVFGGVEDQEFSASSKLFFEQAVAGYFLLLISQITLDELSLACENVRKVLENLPSQIVLEVPVELEAAELAQRYIDHGILGQKWFDDAMHVAVASVAQANLIISWNFKHMVNYDKIQKFNSVNLFLGYRELDIRSPLEVVYGD